MVGGRADLKKKALQGGLQPLSVSLISLLPGSHRGRGDRVIPGRAEPGLGAASQGKQLFSIGLKVKPGNVLESAEAASSTPLRGPTPGTQQFTLHSLCPSRDTQSYPTAHYRNPGVGFPLSPFSCSAAIRQSVRACPNCLPPTASSANPKPLPSAPAALPFAGYRPFLPSL